MQLRVFVVVISGDFPRFEERLGVVRIDELCRHLSAQAAARDLPFVGLLLTHGSHQAHGPTVGPVQTAQSQYVSWSEDGSAREVNTGRSHPPSVIKYR